MIETRSFRDGGFERWSKSRTAVFGAGATGGPIALEIARSGGRVGIFDFDIGEPANAGTQRIEVGEYKAITVARACNAANSGRAQAYCFDVRRAGIGLLDQFDLYIDATDDTNLSVPVAEFSNGLGKPMLRVALDGGGEAELGRVLCSSSATGHACAVCSYSLADLKAELPRTGCPDLPAIPRRPTIAGSPMAISIAGLAVLSAQRLTTGNDAHLALGRETWVDWSNLKVMSASLPRSDNCLSGHIQWILERISVKASTVTFHELFQIAASRLGCSEVRIEPYRHPLCTQAACVCGEVTFAVGTRWASPPECSDCHRPMSWRPISQITQIDASTASDLGILDIPLVELGMPAVGAMLIAHADGKPLLRLVLN